MSTSSDAASRLLQQRPIGASGARRRTANARASQLAGSGLPPVHPSPSLSSPAFNGVVFGATTGGELGTLMRTGDDASEQQSVSHMAAQRMLLGESVSRPSSRQSGGTARQDAAQRRSTRARRTATLRLISEILDDEGGNDAAKRMQMARALVASIAGGGERRAEPQREQKREWDPSALAEIAHHGTLGDGGPRPGDRYAHEERRALGARPFEPAGPVRRAARADSSSASSRSEASSESRFRAAKRVLFRSLTRSSSTTSASTCMPAHTSHTDPGSDGGSLCTERFVFYSATAGVHQADSLGALGAASGLKLSDLVEAAARSLTPDQLRTDRRTDAAAPGCFWLDVTDPTVGEMRSLARAFGIHPLTVEDVMSEEEARDKLEAFGDYLFVVYRTIADEEPRLCEIPPRASGSGSDGIATASFAMVVKRSCILTFHRTRCADHIASVLSRLGDIAGDALVTPSYIAYALIDDITDVISPVMRSIELEVDTIDELVLILSHNEQADMLQRIGAARRKILALWRMLQGKPEVVKALTKFLERHADEPHARDADCGFSLGSSTVDCHHSDKQPRPRHFASDSAHAALPRSPLSASSPSIAQLPRAASLARIARPQASRQLPQFVADTPTEPWWFQAVTAEEVAHYLTDVYDHIVALVNGCSHCDMVLSRAHSNYLARISLELGQATVDTSMFAGRWTVIGAILVPLNVVTGLFGMNVPVPGQNASSTNNWFIILGSCLSFIAIVLVWARFKKIF